MKKLSLFLIALAMILVSCKPEIEKPTVVTKSVGDVTKTSAKVVGQVAADGGAEVTERGICWNTEGAPEVIHYRAKDTEGGLGIFTLNILDLVPNTQYYVRAYATNKKGVAYGDEAVFTTEDLGQPSQPVVITSEVTKITYNSAICGGNVTTDCGEIVVIARGVCWSKKQNPTIVDNKTIDGEGAGCFTSNLSGLSSNTTYYVRAYTTYYGAYATNYPLNTVYGEEVIFTTEKETCPITGKVNGFAYVDLGLSVKWATYNVGATIPEEYGNYYSWGEIETKNEYTRDNCLTEGVDIGGDIAGNAKYDVARVKWGSKWRLPRLKELTELVEDCTWKCSVMNGIEGYKVIGKNGNYIFLPAAGFRNGTELLNAAQMGYIWCSEIEPTLTKSYAYSLQYQPMNDNAIRYWITMYGYRPQGYSVRPVTE